MRCRGTVLPWGLQDEDGGTLIEFAMFAGLLVFIFMGVVDYSFYIKEEMELVDGAASAAAYGAVPGNESNLSAIAQVANNQIQGVPGYSVTATNVWTCTPGGASVASTSTCSGGVTPYKYVVVTASGTLPPSFKYPGLTSDLVLSATSSYRVPWSH